MNYDIESIKNKMLVKYPFFGSVIANVEYKEDKNIKTAATNGKEIHYNPSFLNKLSISEQIFVLSHEVCHIAFNHILRSEGKDHEIWNIATDAVINAFLKKDGLKMVEGGVDMADAVNYDAEQLYEKLLQEKKQQQQQGQENQFQNSDNTSKDNVIDNHNMWEDTIKKYTEEKAEKNKKENIFEKIFKKKEQTVESELEKKQKEMQKLGEKESFKKNKEQKKKELEDLKDMLSKQIISAGFSSHGDVRKVNNVGYSKPLLDWRYILKETIKYDIDWSYSNATIEDGVVSANLEEYPIPDTEIVLDTSGSINEVLLKNFLRECKNILKHTKLKVGCFDTEFYGFNEIRTEEDIEKMEFIGGGWTDFNIAVNAFTNRVENKIIFTDGDASIPDMPCDAIWIVFGKKNISPKGGKVIRITNEQLKCLLTYQDDNYKSKVR